MSLILAIESSCDETAVALLEKTKVIQSVIASQAELHAPYGGVVPEMAARKHLETLNPMIENVLSENQLKPGDVQAVSVTVGPGLIIALLVGMAAAKSFAFAEDLPLIGINHLEGHIYSAFLAYPELKPPLIAVLVSGGHTLLVHMTAHGEYRTMGETLDDAVGEAFDKVSALLGLGYPGGPVIDKLATQGDAARFALPRALLRNADYNFSLSGVKTAVSRLIAQLKEAGESPLPDIAASFQQAVFEVLLEKAFRAVGELSCTSMVVAGGVAANSQLRKMFEERARKENVELFIPPLELCGDNAAMIGRAAYERFIKGERLPFSSQVYSRLPLEQEVNVVIG